MLIYDFRAEEETNSEAEQMCETNCSFFTRLLAISSLVEFSYKLVCILKVSLSGLQIAFLKEKT